MKWIINKVLSGSERTRVVKKNIIGSFAIKGLSIATILAIVPFTIHLIDQEKYGIWMTIYSLVTWVNVMDIGLGNGFRNKFTEAVALKNHTLAREYVHTLYTGMALMAMSLLVIYSSIHFFINWRAILNVKPTFDENLQQIMWWVFSLFCIQLFLKNINTVLLSLQKTSFSNLLVFIGNFSSLIIIYILQKFKAANLFSISMAFMITPVIVNLIVTPFFFLTQIPEYIPRFSLIPDKRHLRNLMSLGLKFFFIQIAAVIVLSTDNIVITQLFGPRSVTPYSIAYRLFSTALVFLTIIVTPFWSAFTEASAKEDTPWITRSMKKLLLMWAAFSVGVMLLWLISPFIIRVWVGQQVHVSYELTFQFALFAIIAGWNYPFTYYLSSIGKIKLELIIAFFQCVLAIPITIFCAKYLHLGTTGVIMGTNIVMIFRAILVPIQSYKIINQKATGIWNQ